MKHINQRNIKISDELMNLCYSYGASHINLDIKTQGKETIFLLKSEIKDLPSDTLDDLVTLMNYPRCHEMEECYWELTGDGDLDSELSLVGIMVDEAYINYEDSILTIELKRRI
ncbi:hypothetical protein [Clostridium hydrogeniformans]|uniref:hypothetical protein n=1 Tax=Clostridium hydrogeniformans TaxID=349933 RepID=UPI000481467E|nr:hypothetical protein [Clostridium hydrogeniformans]